MIRMFALYIIGDYWLVEWLAKKRIIISRMFGHYKVFVPHLMPFFICRDDDRSCSSLYIKNCSSNLLIKFTKYEIDSFFHVYVIALVSARLQKLIKSNAIKIYRGCLYKL